jgi:hypothetical protein
VIFPRRLEDLLIVGVLLITSKMEPTKQINPYFFPVPKQVRQTPEPWQKLLTFNGSVGFVPG